MLRGERRGLSRYEAGKEHESVYLGLSVSVGIRRFIVRYYIVGIYQSFSFRDQIEYVSGRVFI